MVAATDTRATRLRKLTADGTADAISSGELDRTGILGSSLKLGADEPLFLEPTLRGYDLPNVDDHEMSTISFSRRAFLIGIKL